MTRYKFDRQSVNKDVDVKRPDEYPSNLLELAFRGLCTDSVTDLPLVWTKDDIDQKFNNMAEFPSIDLNTYGADAIRRLSPLKPAVNLGQFIHELKDLPQIPGKLFKRAEFFKSLGSEYLNAEFGWAPFLSDVLGMLKTYNTLNQRIAQIRKDNGQPVRRRVTLKRNIDVGTPEVLPSADLRLYPNMRGEYVDTDEKSFKQCKCVRQVVTKEYIWAVGRTRYYIPDVSGDSFTQKAIDSLFGLNLTPSLIWEITPWSWLIDWFSNVGDVMANLSNNGLAPLLIDYAYVMRSFSKETTYTTFTYPTANTPWGETPAGGKFKSVSMVSKETEERKERVAATPFGFGLQIGSLSASQLAILTALGLSRSNFLP